MNSEEFINKVILIMSDIEPQSKADFKCAPGKKFEAGSCASLAVLEEMARSYNIDACANDKIVLSKNLSLLNPQKYKIYLVHEIGKRIGNKCTTQKCWSTQKFVKNMSKAARVELEKYTYRPNSPQGRFDWLSTFNINDSMNQYEKKYDGFKFYGAVPMDFADLRQCSINRADYDKLYNSGITKIGIIFNLDEHDKPGSHWVAMYTDLEKAKLLYFDSFGIKPEKRVRALMRQQARYFLKTRNLKMNDIYANYNSNQHQKDNTECGVYSMNFLIRMARGDDFDDLCKNVISDKQINKCRLIYFDKYSKDE